MRVGELERETGLTRDVIHHYVRLGLLPPPEKATATSAWYDERHLDAMKRVRALRARGLSLPEIGALLAGPGAPVGARDLDAVAALLAAPERPSVLRDSLSAEARALADAMRLDGDALTPALAAALAAATADPATARITRDALARCADAVARLTDATLAAQVEALAAGVDPVASARTLAAALDAWRAQREHAAREAMLASALEAARTARRGAWLATSAAAVEGATLRLVVIERALAVDAHNAALHGERVRLLLGASSSRRAGEAAREALAQGLDDPWVELALGVAALDGDAPDTAVERFERARALRGAWGLAEAFLGAATLYGAARAGDGLVDAARAVALVDGARPRGDDPLPARLRTHLVAAQTLLALPTFFGRAGAAVERLRGLLDTAREVGPDDLARGTGELARIEGNAWLTLGDALARAGDVTGARDAWARCAPAAGCVAYAARARLRVSTR